MIKIDFKDLPDTTTPVDATNLNLLQDNVEDDIGDLSQLETTIKTDLVSAINEANQHSSAVYNEYNTSTTGSYSANYINNAIQEIYSTNEIKTNKVWIDNKPIYRKVYNVTGLASGNNYFGDTTGIEEYINGYGIVHRSNGNHYFISSYQTTDAFVAIGMDNNAYNKFNLVIGSGVSNITDAYVIVEYTKTTD